MAPFDWPSRPNLSALGAAATMSSFLALTLPLMPVQAALVRLLPSAARRLPHWYHKRVCRLLGVRLHVEGRIDTSRPVLVVANHTSWLDVPVLSAIAPLSFVAKQEVGGWPFVSALARLQRTVFVDRTRRAAVGETTGEISRRLRSGDTLVLFAEGTSSDGNRVLPFLSSLFAAVMGMREAGAGGVMPAIQTLALVYSHRHGIPLSRHERALVGWYGDMEMTGHAWQLLKAGPLDAQIRIGPARVLDAFEDRKRLARLCEAEVRESVVRLLRAREAAEPVQIAAQQSRRPPAIPRGTARISQRWK
jgi:1-acyl-sn-glycerol-3-phosphate acyltransferase